MRRIWNKGDENLTEVKAEKRICVSCGRNLVQTIDDNKELNGHWCCPNANCPRGWLLAASYLMESGNRIRPEEEIGRLADFFLKNYPDEIGVGDPANGESAVDMAIRLLTKDDKTREEIFKEAHPKGLAPGAKNNCALADPENWPCQWAIPDLRRGDPGYHCSLGHHCPKTCDKIQLMKDGEAWSS